MAQPVPYGYYADGRPYYGGSGDTNTYQGQGQRQDNQIGEDGVDVDVEGGDIEDSDTDFWD